jgi:hypothetical protein
VSFDPSKDDFWLAVDYINPFVQELPPAAPTTNSESTIGFSPQRAPPDTLTFSALNTLPFSNTLPTSTRDQEAPGWFHGQTEDPNQIDISPNRLLSPVGPEIALVTSSGEHPSLIVQPLVSHSKHFIEPAHSATEYDFLSELANIQSSGNYTEASGFESSSPFQDPLTVHEDIPLNQHGLATNSDHFYDADIPRSVETDESSGDYTEVSVFESSSPFQHPLTVQEDIPLNQHGLATNNDHLHDADIPGSVESDDLKLLDKAIPERSQSEETADGQDELWYDALGSLCDESWDEATKSIPGCSTFEKAEPKTCSSSNAELKRAAISCPNCTATFQRKHQLK